MPRRNGMLREESLLGLESGGIPSGQGELAPLSPGHSLCRDEQRVIDESNKQELVINGFRRKTLLGLTAIGEIRYHGSLVFQDTVVAVFDRQNQIRGTECEAYVAEFTRANLQGCARGLLAAVGAGENGIGVEIARPLYPEPESFLRRLFG
jgi:hypothetical protein